MGQSHHDKGEGKAVLMVKRWQQDTAPLGQVRKARKVEHSRLMHSGLHGFSVLQKLVLDTSDWLQRALVGIHNTRVHGLATFGIYLSD